MKRSGGVEKALLLTGLAAIDLWLLSNADKAIYQAWQGWVFDREVRGQPANLDAFLAEKREQLKQWLGAPDRNQDQNTEARRSRVPAEPPASQRNSAPLRVSPPADAVVGRLTIPRLRMSAMIREGVGESTLRVALGHIPNTAFPGESGNIGIAGHRDTLFRALQNIRTDDLILLETLDGNYVYRVEDTAVVGPRDTQVLQARQPLELTLVTCYPFHYVGAAPERFIVKAHEVSATSKKTSFPKLHESQDGPTS
jgi:sortase A